MTLTEIPPMRALPRIVILIGLGLLNGCGRPETPRLATATGPHGGPLVALPDGAGFGEIVLESASSRDPRVRVVAYFLDPGLKAPMALLPTDVMVALDFPDRPAEDAALAPESKPADRTGTGKGRFASKAGEYAVDPLMGAIRGMLGGRPFSVRFTDRR